LASRGAALGPQSEGFQERQGERVGLQMNRSTLCWKRKAFPFPTHAALGVPNFQVINQRLVSKAPHASFRSQFLF